jgi:nucleotide-binding universal stress UspA family protein
MARVLACVDSSSYVNSVCDHAAWFAGRSDASIEVIQVLRGAAADLPVSLAARRTTSSALIEHCLGRLRDEGVSDARGVQLQGEFIELVASRAPDLLVMGKRGDASESRRRRLGSSVDAMIRATQAPICLTSKLFLPIRRGLILLDADMSHRRAVEFVASHPSFAGLEMDMMVVAAPGDDAGPKLDWAKAALPVRIGDVFAMEADGLDTAASKYIEGRAADLVVVSRAVIAPDPETRLGRIEERGVWGMRTPVVIC